MYSILAAILAGKSLELEGWKRFKYVSMSLGFFVMSLLTYQTAAMFYWVVWGGKFLFEKPGDFNTLWKRIWGVSQIAFLSMLTYLVILKVFCQPYVNYLEGLYNPYDWSSNYWAKLIWFFREPVYNALNIWAIFPDIKIMWLTLLIFIIGGCVTWVQLRRNKMVSKEVYYWGGCLFIVVFSAFILAYLPNILNQRPSPFYRTFLGLTTMIIFIWLWSGQALLSLIPRQLRDISLTVILFIFLNLGVYQCYKNVWLYRVLPSQIEWEYTVNQMAAADFSFYDHMIVVMPFAGRTDRYDEFGIFTTFFHQDIKGFMLAALNLAGKSDDYWQRFRNLTYVSSEQEIPQNGRFLIVDMRQPKSQYEQIIIRSKE
jgi:hypothetical protein